MTEIRPKSSNTLDGLAARRRPTHRDEEVIKAGARWLAERLKEWFGKDERRDFQDVDATTAALEDILKTGFEDGYELAKALEDRHGWAVDALLVDHLNCSPVMHARDVAIKDWIESEGIVPRLAVGDRLTFETERFVSAVFRRVKGVTETVVGEIAEIYTAKASYSIFVEALGHVRRDSGQCGTTGIIMEFERAERWLPDDDPRRT